MNLLKSILRGRRHFNALLFAGSFTCLIATGFFITNPGNSRTTGELLLVWAGDQARTHPDFVTVVDFDENSQNYGRVINIVPLPNPGASGNEPHHTGLSSDGKVLACGGLLSLLRGQKEIFFFDISDPARPQFISSADPPLSAITDEFYPLSTGGFLVTMMGSAQGDAPGRVAEFSKDLQLVGEYPVDPPQDGFNPHGISVRPELNLMITSDFVSPASTLNAIPGDLLMRSTVRVWDFQARKILRTIQLPRAQGGSMDAAGSMDAGLIPGDPQARGYTVGMVNDQLYLLDTRNGTASGVFDFGSIAQGAWPSLTRMTEDGTRLFVSMHLAGKVVMLDIANPAQPKVLKVLDLGPNSGPHYLALTADERRLVISDYFLDEDDFGKVQAEGDHKVHVAIVTTNDLVLDPRFQLDFNTAIPSGPARPHGMEFIK